MPSRHDPADSLADIIENAEIICHLRGRPFVDESGSASAPAAGRSFPMRTKPTSPASGGVRLECRAEAVYSIPIGTLALPATPSDQATASRDRPLAVARLQEIEGNPLDADDRAMFEMFEREGWSHERRRAYILAAAAKLAAA